jgi:hypothetical protein
MMIPFTIIVKCLPGCSLSIEFGYTTPMDILLWGNKRLIKFTNRYN